MNLDSLLEIKLARPVRILVLVVACLLPTLYVLKQYDPVTKFTWLICAGEKYEQKALPEFRALHPDLSHGPIGYDGQFYAQVAIKPLLNDPKLKDALHMPSYRARKIFLPALAFILGLGKPAWVVNIYAVLNLAFLFMLLFGMVHYLRAETVRDYLCILATVFTTGTLFSLERALTDLPAMTIGFYAGAWSGALASCAIGLGLLTRDTSLIFLLRDAWPLPRDRSAFLKLAARTLLLAILPYVIWRLYVRHIFGEMSVQSLDIFGMPLVGAWEYFHASWQGLHATPFLFVAVHADTQWEVFLFATLGGVSMIVQVVSLVVWPRLECPYWRMAMGLVVMMVFFTSHVYEEYAAMCRVTLSVTLAFNISLMRRRGGMFVFLFIAGNAGLLWGLHDILGTLWRPPGY